MSVTATDIVGNVSVFSIILPIEIDTTSPSTPSITTTASLTNDSTPAIEGTADSGSIINLFIDGNSSGISTRADVNGDFSINAPSQLDGTYVFAVSSSDPLGNSSEISNSVSITIDATAPGKPSIITTTSLTNDATPTI